MRATQNILVLVVDDDPMVRFLTDESLTPQGFRVVEAETGDEALRLLNDLRPDIILLDVMMPGIDGFTTCSRLRALPQGRHVPVLMMTGLEDADSIRHAYQVGATDFITKPINFGLLEFRLDYMLRAKLTADELRQSEDLLASAQRLARLGHFVLEQDARFSVWSSQTQAVLGLEAEHPPETLAQLLERAHPDDRARIEAALSPPAVATEMPPVEFRVRQIDGAIRTILQHSRAEMGESGIRVIGTVQDITAQRRAERTIHQLAYFDQITGLPNRIQIEQRLSELLREGEAAVTSLSVLAIDLDHFQRVNDTLGHDTGNELLKAVSRRLIQCLRQGLGDTSVPPAELVARSGGDEFCILLPGIDSPERARAVADSVHQIFRRPFVVGNEELVLTTSIGVTLFPQDGREPEILLRHAEMALANAKRRGRDCTEVFHVGLNERSQGRMTVETNLRQALGTQQLALHYQPKIDSRSGDVTGMEALIRWRHPTLGPVSPGEFIPVAEESGLILPLGEWILTEACRQTAIWARGAAPGLTCAVNLSGLQLRQADFPALVREILAESGLPPAALQLELTETVVMDNSDHIGILDELKMLGVTLAIDDFGTGYSSLSYLTRLPVDVLKIDQSFVRGLGTNEQGSAIVAAVIAMGHSLGLKIVAEGVETPHHLAVLKQHHCDELQGWLFSKALPGAEFEAWVRQYRSTLTPGTSNSHE